MSRARRLGCSVWAFGLVTYLGASVTSAPARAGEAAVLEVNAVCSTMRICDFQAKVLHSDTGERHYADRFEIVSPDGEVLGTRVLRHPHVHEQPFVRGLVGVEIPEGVTEVVVRAHDSQHGYGGKTVTAVLEFPSPPVPAPAAAEPG